MMVVCDEGGRRCPQGPFCLEDVGHVSFRALNESVLTSWALNHFRIGGMMEPTVSTAHSKLVLKRYGS